MEKPRKGHDQLLDEEELLEPNTTCHPSACERATEGPARRCLRGAGRAPSACNGKTGGHDPCCLQGPPPVGCRY